MKTELHKLDQFGGSQIHFGPFLQVFRTTHYFKLVNKLGILKHIILIHLNV